MAAKQLPLPGEIIKKSNALCRARWAVDSVYEPRLVALVSSKVRADDKAFTDYEIPVSELIGSAADGRTYKLVSDVVDNLLGRVVTMPRDHGGFAKCAIFSFCEYDPKRGIIKAHFDPAMMPHYLELKKRFAEYNLFEFLSLPSTYSQRIFEILKSWDDKPEATIDLADLRGMLGLDKEFQRWPDFRRYVVEKAYKDIRKKTTLTYEWEPIKRGRAVVAVRFIFNPKRAEKVSTKRKKESATNTQDQNNNTFIEAMQCFAKLGGKCKEHLSKKHCTLCRNINGKQRSLPFDN